MCVGGNRVSLTISRIGLAVGIGWFGLIFSNLGRMLLYRGRRDLIGEGRRPTPRRSDNIVLWQINNMSATTSRLKQSPGSESSGGTPSVRMSAGNRFMHSTRSTYFASEQNTRCRSPSWTRIRKLFSTFNLFRQHCLPSKQLLMFNSKRRKQYQRIVSGVRLAKAVAPLAEERSNASCEKCRHFTVLSGNGFPSMAQLSCCSIQSG